MVKVKVSGETGKVVAFEGMAYAYNHIERSTPNAVVGEEVARSRADGVVVNSIRLAVVPQGMGEILTYEVFGEVGEKKYFIYVDATTGEEINIDLKEIAEADKSLFSASNEAEKGDVFLDTSNRIVMFLGDYGAATKIKGTKIGHINESVDFLHALKNGRKVRFTKTIR